MFRGILSILGPSYSWLWRIGTFSMCRWRWRSRSYCRFRGLFSINSNLLHLEDTACYQWNKSIPKAIARAYLTDSIRGSGYTSSTQWYESPKQVTLPPFGITYFFALGHLIVRHGSASDIQDGKTISKANSKKKEFLIKILFLLLINRLFIP